MNLYSGKNFFYRHPQWIMYVYWEKSECETSLSPLYCCIPVLVYIASFKEKYLYVYLTVIFQKSIYYVAVFTNIQFCITFTENLKYYSIYFFRFFVIVEKQKTIFTTDFLPLKKLAQKNPMKVATVAVWLWKWDL